MISFESVCRLQNGKLVKVVECFGPQSVDACKCFLENALNSFSIPNIPHSPFAELATSQEKVC